MTPKQIYDVTIGVLLLVAIGSGVYFYNDYQSLKENAKAHESVETVASKATDSLGAATTNTVKFELDVKDHRAASDRAFQELIKNDQSVRDFADCPIPDILREQDERPISGLEDSQSGSDGLK